MIPFDLKSIGLEIDTEKVYVLKNIETGEEIRATGAVAARLHNEDGTHKVQKDRTQLCGRIAYAKMGIEWFVPLLDDVKTS